MSTISNLINKKISFHNKEASCFSLIYDGRFDSELAKTGLKIYACKKYSQEQEHNINNQPYDFVYNNINFIDESEIADHNYDFILCNNIITQFNQAHQLSQILHIPVLVVSHEKYHETHYHLQKRLQELNANIVFTNKNDKYKDPIIYGTEKLENVDKDIDIMLDGQFQSKDYHILKFLKQAIPNLTVVGNNKGLSCSYLPANYNEYRNMFARCKVYINLPTQHHINYQTLWAMSNGAYIVSLDGEAIKSLNAKDIQIFKQPSEIPGIVNNLSYRDLTKLTNNEFVNEEFSLANFRNEWTNKIIEFSQKVYIK